MPEMEKMNGVPRRELHVFYVLDTSGSMSGEPIAVLNGAMTETVEIVRSMAKSNADALVKIAVLEFNSGCRWLQPQGPEQLEDFIWQDLQAGGLTDMGDALKELDSKLSRNKFLSSMTGAYLPVIIFMTDGYATDDYKKALEQIRKNKWFAQGTKIGFAVGAEADQAMIAQITGSYEAVVHTDDLELFARMLKFASITATMLCSESHTTEDGVTGADIVAKAKADILEPKDMAALTMSAVQNSLTQDASAQDDDWEDFFDDADFD